MVIVLCSQFSPKFAKILYARGHEDKIYSFVGITRDCHDGSVSMDYSKPLFEVYEAGYHPPMLHYPKIQYSRRTHFYHHQRKDEDDRSLYPRLSEFGEAHLRCEMTLPSILRAEIQLLFSLPFRVKWVLSHDTHPFMVMGVHAGNVSTIGPSFDDIIGIPSAGKLCGKRGWRNIPRMWKNSEKRMRPSCEYSLV